MPPRKVIVSRAHFVESWPWPAPLRCQLARKSMEGGQRELEPLVFDEKTRLTSCHRNFHTRTFTTIFPATEWESDP